MDKIKVTIGIPAYNEEANILKLLHSVLEQSEQGYEICEILVMSDCSVDRTEELVRSLGHPKIKLFADRVRKGKPSRLSQIFREAKGDVVVLVDADCVLLKEGVSHLMVMFRQDPGVVLVGGTLEPKGIESEVQKALSSSVRVRQSIAREYKGGKSVYSFSGTLMALPREFAKKITIPSTVGDDAYIYFTALKHNMRVASTPTISGNFYLPYNISDYMKQANRFSDSQKMMEKFFGAGPASQYAIPKRILFRSVVNELFRHPRSLLSYMTLKALMAFYNIGRQASSPNGLWETPESTKGKVEQQQ